VEINKDNVPHILAECARCSFIFNLTYGIDCPRCNSVAISWARVATEYAPPTERQLGKEPDVDWLYALMALDSSESPR
jgi:DNA-directed RNA polymerase subunit RPC12/RpoP